MSTISSSGILSYVSATGLFSYSGTFSSGDANTWPLTISAGLTVTFGTDFIINDSGKYFIVGGNDVTVDGNDKVVSTNIQGSYGLTVGLIQNGTGSNAYSNCKLKNIGIVSTNFNSSWCLTQVHFGRTVSSTLLSNCSITNCYFISQNGLGTPAPNQYNGFILAAEGNATIDNCFAILTCSLPAYQATTCNGISRGNLSPVSNCFFICAKDFKGEGISNGGPLIDTDTITNCYVIIGGNLLPATSQVGGGGIGSGRNTSISNCYVIVGGNIGDINNPNDTCGGIIRQTGTEAHIVSNCYVIVAGSIIGNSGGIAASGTTGILQNCYVNYAGSTAPTNVIQNPANTGTEINCNYPASGTNVGAVWTEEGANWSLNADGYSSAWTTTDLTNKTPYLLSAYQKAVTLSQTVNFADGAIDLTNYGKSLLKGLVSSSQPGSWTYQTPTDKIGYSGLTSGTSSNLNIDANNVLSNLTDFTFDNETAIQTAYNTTDNIYDVIPYMYSNTSDVNIIYGVVCFLEGSKILTSRGYIAIENIEKDDLIATSTSGYKGIYKIGKETMINAANEERIKDQLYVCCKENYKELSEDLVITGSHSILVDSFESDQQREATRTLLGDIYVTDEKYRLPACIDTRTKVYEEKGEKIIYHISLENDEYYWNYGIYANGLLVESCSKNYIDNHCKMNEPSSRGTQVPL